MSPTRSSRVPSEDEQFWGPKFFKREKGACMLRIDFVFALRRVSVFPLLVVSLFASRSETTRANEPSQIRVTVSPIPAMVVA